MSREATSAEKMVFGANVQIGDDGKPIEMGFGAAAKKLPSAREREAAAEAAAQAQLQVLEERAAQEAERNAADKEAKRVMAEAEAAAKQAKEDAEFQKLLDEKAEEQF